MPKMTIAQLRERELSRLVSFKTTAPTEEDFQEARKLMNSFYRLCGLSERNLYLANDARTCNLASTRRSEERESKWWSRLDNLFSQTYGLNLVYCGYAPSICKKLANGAVSQEIQRFFYD